MTNPRDAAMAMECVKVSMSQTVSGMKITFVIHPDDKGYANDLFGDPVGSRYQMALVLLTEDGEPIPPKSKTDGDRAVVSAGMLPREAAFRQWLVSTGRILDPDEDCAIAYIHRLCGIDSRADLRHNAASRAEWNKLATEFAVSRSL